MLNRLTAYIENITNKAEIKKLRITADSYENLCRHINKLQALYRNLEKSSNPAEFRANENIFKTELHKYSFITASKISSGAISAKCFKPEDDTTIRS